MFESITFGDIVEQVSAFIRDNDPKTLAVIRDEVNKEYEKIARSKDWGELEVLHNHHDVTVAQITQVAGQAYLALPADCVQVKQISDSTNDYTFINRRLEETVELDIARLGTNGTPIYYSELGLKATQAPLSTNSMIEVTNTDSADTGKTIRIKGLSHNATNPVIVDEVVALSTSGTDTTNTFRAGWSVYSISTDDPPSAGARYDIEQNSSQTIVASIAPDFNEARYFIVQFNQPPASASNLVVIYKRKVQRLVGDNDVPLIPVGHALIEAGIAKMRQHKRDYQQAQIHKQEAAEAISALLAERDLQREQLKQLRPDFRTRRFVRGFRSPRGGGSST